MRKKATPASILDLLHEDGIVTKRVASTKGGEYKSPCPVCGGKDRFTAWPDPPDKYCWFCRQCNKGGDIIEYFRHVRGFSYKGARELLGYEPAKSRSTSRGRPWKLWTPYFLKPPPEKWQAQALRLTESAQRTLWSAIGEETQAWLTAERGLSETTIKNFRLGLINNKGWGDTRNWGLPDEYTERGWRKRLCIPAGLLIPYFPSGRFQRVRIRKKEQEMGNDGPRYQNLKGSNNSPMLLKSDTSNVLVVESDLDAMLLYQEACDLVRIVSLGSANDRPDHLAHSVLLNAEVILVALDADNRGATNAWHWWPKHYSKVRRWPPVDGKDPCECGKLEAIYVPLNNVLATNATRS